ncbi:chromosome segregation protein SMC [Glaciecola sp. SC05]|uniref:chromosome segregation protein SMC n=1 Tax=Glaciecola sp. SC05 TaxID=1987355 RepID=UPI003527FE36
MRLKKIKLAGFKSFVDPTSIPFPGDMTAVVGPNGCGKSNVIDAVRWVLGESSAKNLRGDSMTDVIFNGSSARKPVSQCSVELVFDNSSGRIGGEFANYSELSVKRVVTKDAVSSYLLNGSKCRRRDITDLFLGTGLGPRSYAIIEQGMISRLIESKPQELRVFIEEAAGISKYKERRKETLSRIAHTKDNLLRLDDVRQELGDQLAKLQRQAAAANRYKELKAQERSLKAQLATLRWLAQSEMLKRSDELIANFQAELDGLLSSKQGDESGLQALKNEQSMTKQDLADLQQHIYTLGNDITKLEQSQLFARKRGNQIQAEIQHIRQQSHEFELQLSAIAQELDSTQSKIIDIQPDTIILQEQLDELTHTQEQYQEKSKALASALKQTEDHYYQLKQGLQLKHSQLQQTLSLQQRTESRIAELQTELSELTQHEQDASGEEIARLETKLHELSHEISKLHQQQSMATKANETAAIARETADTQCKDAQTEVIKTQAELHALTELQTTNSDKLADYLSAHSFLPSWQAFTAQKGYEKALETALGLFTDAIVVSQLSHAAIAAATKHGTQPLFLADKFVSQKRQQSLASYVEASSVPSVFNAILIAKDSAEAIALCDSLNPGEYVISLDGEIFAKDLYISSEKPTDGKTLRAARIAVLQKSLVHQQTQCSHMQNRLEQTELTLLETQQQTAELAKLLNQQQNAHALLSRDIHSAKVLQSKRDLRVGRIESDIANQQEALYQEQMRCEILTAEIEDASIEVSECEAKKFDVDSDKQGVDIQLQALNSQLQHTQQKLYQQALESQGLQNSFQILQEQRKNKQEQIQENEEKLLLLKDEAENLLLPSEQQQENLQQMLNEKAALEQRQNEKQQVLTEIEEQITNIEKGQVGINQKLDRVKAQMESERLQAQTAIVKAQSFLEQLAEMKILVKDVLEDLPDDAQESAYQDSLEKVLGSLSRLGAVNLAAVDEFDEQAKRKQHLDDQNNDLSQALETLENAMRKIDKETRARFKHTFDQVNSDLKILFPKVFGGGSAYLDLTDDDLLETGVTIMARPPGKKNSTIALLSGGEKALTALSLVFAIFRLNPAPFCLLDEVDAPLDDANVGRFCKLVSEMSKTVQFIYITHNKVAMEMATHLSGVTMAEPGVSRMVAVDMEEALAIAE